MGETRTMLIYRVENKSGRGPWFDRPDEPLARGLLAHWEGLPTPMCDDISIPADWRYRWRSGCRSMGELLKWFPQDVLVALTQLGKYRIVIYRVPNEYVRQGGVQVVFCCSNGQREMVTYVT